MVVKNTRQNIIENKHQAIVCLVACHCIVKSTESDLMTTALWISNPAGQ